MTVDLQQADYRELKLLVQKLPQFATVRDRWRLVRDALAGSPGADAVIGQLDLDGAPESAAGATLQFLMGFGQVAPGKEALGVFLNYLLDYTGEEQQAFLRGLFARYPLDAPIAQQPPVKIWLGEDTPDDVREKIIGENTLLHVRFLQIALEAARAVVHLRVPREGGGSALGTGFMVSSDLLITNHHVIRTSTEAEAACYTFNYQLDVGGAACPTLTARGRRGGLFHTHADLDYTVVQLEDVPPFGTPLKPQRKKVARDERVAIIQHPGGHYKQISFQNNFVAFADGREVQYTTSTLPGSSGSPVFNALFEVVAVHHSGGMIPEPETARRYLRNAGTSMIAILDDLRAHAPEISARLGG
jgi:V8-like Glu-specific endopeptidase